MTRSRRALVALALVALVLAGCGRSSGEPAPTPAPATGNLPAGVDAVVRTVVDGDTIEISGGERVRLIGIDTPETKDPNRPVGCFGREATRFTATLLPRGTPVRLVGDVEQRDRFDRLLAYVYRRADGLFVNAELLRRGYAQLLTIPPNVAHTDEFVAIAAQARESSQGLWGACALLPDGKVAPASSSTKGGSG
ncbi:MAG TPA: thermonuclease family protein [Acidimicrobiales bacterium]|nr:thermonuclease family protein [Acidimicrobiales bacterium]